MARIRTVKPEFWTDEKIVQLPFQARLLFIGMWNFADDSGCLEDSPDRIRMQVFPNDVDVDAEQNLDLLVAADLVSVLINDKGIRLYQVNNFEKHQRIDTPSKIRLADKTYKKLTISQSTRRLVAKKYNCQPGETANAECYFCGMPGQIVWHKLRSGKPSAWVSFSGLELDHLHPEAKGGETNHENIVLSCRTCNRGRHDKDMIDFIYSQIDKKQPDVPPQSPQETSNNTQRVPQEYPKSTPRVPLEHSPLEEDMEMEMEMEREGKGKKREMREKKPRASTSPTKKPVLPKVFIANDWKPSERCYEILDSHGIDRTFARMQINEFILYWQERQEKRAGWDATFVNRVKDEWDRRSKAHGLPSTARNGPGQTRDERNAMAAAQWAGADFNLSVIDGECNEVH